jgi:hypothetical protein
MLVMLLWKASSNADNNSSPLLNKDRLTHLNFNYFKMDEAMGLNIIVLRSSRMASPAYHIS